VGDQRPVTILLDSQAAIARLRHTQPGPGQALAIQAHAIAKRLHTQGRQPTIQWVPGHAGVEGNEKADQVAKQAASKLPGRLRHDPQNIQIIHIQIRKFADLDIHADM